MKFSFVIIPSGISTRSKDYADDLMVFAFQNSNFSHLSLQKKKKQKQTTPSLQQYY